MFDNFERLVLGLLVALGIGALCLLLCIGAALSFSLYMAVNSL
jgi:hypothetical protein